MILKAVHLRPPYTLEMLDVFGVVPVRKKDEILDEERDYLYFQVFPGHFYFMRGAFIGQTDGAL